MIDEEWLEKRKQEVLRRMSTREGALEFIKEEVENLIQLCKERGNEKMAEKTRKKYAYLWMIK